MMPMGVCRKACGMEKVENRSRTARVQNDSIGAAGSRLCYPVITA
jgi:hypothetical protein